MAQRADIRERILCCLVLQECTHFCVYVYDDAFDSFIIHRMHSYLAIHHIFHKGMGAFYASSWNVPDGDRIETAFAVALNNCS